MKRLAIFGTGGTIAMHAAEGGLAGLGKAHGPLAQTPYLETIAQVETTDLFQVPSASLSLHQVALIAASAQASTADGIVITHGTDTLEETAFALQLTVSHGAPVVVTGAMRHADQTGADGAANLEAAGLVALDPRSADKGVLVVMDDEIHWAPLVRKRHAFRTHAFSSEPFGPLGWVAEKRVHYALAPAWHLPSLAFGTETPVVPILEAGPGLEPGVIAAMAAVADALVVSLPGGGHVAADAVPALAALAATMPVVFASRTGGGTTLSQTYGYAGSESDLIAKGLIAAGPA